MRIFITADPTLPVPPTHYGGIERVIALLVDGLVERGQHVTLFAHAHSCVQGDLVPYSGAGAGPADTARNAGLLTRETRRRRPDVIHSFGRLAYLLPVLPLRVPKVMSYQRAVTPRTVRRAGRLARGTLSFVGCSRSLVGPVAAIGRWDVIYNAAPIDRLRCRGSVAPDAPLVFLSRLEHIKGVHVAIDVARRAGRRLVIAGNVPDAPEHQAWFAEHVEPHVDGDRVSYVGPVDDAAKDELLGSAAALLMPVLWDEPFGIVMAEALACGTPVIGLQRGAVPEVVRDGVTGFVCRDVEAMAAAVDRLGEISRAACRADAEARFSQRALVDAYEALYERVTFEAADKETVAAGLQTGGSARPRWGR